jgi:electron transfer flavoprotein alpha subunit
MSTQDIFVLAETEQSELAEITFEMLGGARHLATRTHGNVVVLVLGSTGARHAEALADADRVIVIEDPQLDRYAPEAYLAVLESIVRMERPRALLVGSTTIGEDLGPALAARLDVPVLTGCQSVAAEGEGLDVHSSLFGGKVEADVLVNDSPAILMVLPGSFHDLEAHHTKVETRPSPVPLEPGAITLEEVVRPEEREIARPRK